MKSTNSIIILSPGFPKDEEDTTCLPFLQDWALSFKELYPQKQLHIIAFQYPFHRGSFKWNGIGVYSAGGKNTKGLFRIITWLKVLYRVHKIVRQYRVEGLISLWLTECSFIGQRLSRFYKLPFVAYLIGQDANPKNPYLKLIHLEKLKIASVSENTSQRLLQSTGKIATKIIPLGIRESKLGLPANQVKTIDILGVGSLIPLKNYSAFIRVLAKLREEFPEIKAVLIGSGAEYVQLTELAQNYNLDAHLTFTGNIPQSSVFDYMHKSSILLHPSITEGQATVFTEALACAMRVVCFDVGRIDVKDRIFVAENEDDMAKQTTKLLADTIETKPYIIKSMKETVNECLELLAEKI